MPKRSPEDALDDAMELASREGVTRAQAKELFDAYFPVRRHRKEDAVKLLNELLTRPMKSRDIMAEGAKRGISRQVMRFGAMEVGITIKHRGFGKERYTIWSKKRN